MIKTIIAIFLLMILVCCRSKTTQSDLESASKIRRLLPYTSSGWQARVEFDSYLYRKTLSRRLGLPEIEESTGNLEIRVWWQASIYSPSSVWVIHGKGDSSSANRIDYFPNYEQETIIDSTHTFNLKPILGSWDDYYKSIDFSSFWSMPFRHEIKESEQHGCVDGESVTIEMCDKTNFKAIKYPCYVMYRDFSAYKDFTNLVDNIIALQPVR